MPVYFTFHTNIITQKQHMLRFSSAACALSQNTPAICEWAHPLTVGSKEFGAVSNESELQ